MAGRLVIVLRDAGPEDAAALVRLWSECVEARGDSGSEAVSQQMLWREPSVDEATRALRLGGDHPSRRLIIALIDDEIVGATVCVLTTLTPITLTGVLVVTELQVSPRFRRRSVASTLLAAASTYGEENGCEMVVATIPAHAREPNRYLTKLGFTQIAVLRAISATRLQSRLTGKAAQSRDTGKLIAVRRTLRRRQGH